MLGRRGAQWCCRRYGCRKPYRSWEKGAVGSGRVEARGGTELWEGGTEIRGCRCAGLIRLLLELQKSGWPCDGDDELIASPAERCVGLEPFLDATEIRILSLLNGRVRLSSPKSLGSVGLQLAATASFPRARKVPPCARSCRRIACTTCKGRTWGSRAGVVEKRRHYSSSGVLIELTGGPGAPRYQVRLIVPLRLSHS